MSKIIPRYCIVCRRQVEAVPEMTKEVEGYFLNVSPFRSTTHPKRGRTGIICTACWHSGRTENLDTKL